MIRGSKARSSMKIDTYYSKAFEDEGVEFTKPSLTDQSYGAECDIRNLVAMGIKGSQGLLRYGVQDYTTMEEALNVRNEFKNAWNRLSYQDQLDFGSFENYVAQVSDVNNYKPEVLPEVGKDNQDSGTDKSDVKEFIPK